ncbi:MAG: hypothetical protein J0L94_05760 [Rhodothermia bacterium]|nr:hypothetical protein [Rhodothermia bacterium]
MWKTFFLILRLLHIRIGRRKKMNAQRMGTFQQKKLTAIVRSIHKHVPTYQKLNPEVMDAQRAFPVQVMNALEAKFEQGNVLGLSYDHARKILHLDGEKPRSEAQYRDATLTVSAGTAGRKHVWITDEAERADEALALLDVLLPPLPRKKYHIACFVQGISALLLPVNNRLVETRSFDWQGINEHVLHQLRSFNPSIVIATPSVLRALASEVKQGRLMLYPDRLFSTSEVLSDIDGDWISRQFGQTVENLYWAQEGFLGQTCVFGTMHLNEDRFLVEHNYLDAEKKRFFPVITSLNRKTQPLFRYKLDDILVEKRMTCGCGSRHMAIEHIEGRWCDVLYLRAESTGDWIPVFQDTLRRTIMNGSPAIQQYQVRQVSPSEVDIYLNVPTEMFGLISSSVGEALKRLFGQMGVRLPLINFFLLDKHEEKSLRFRPVVQLTPITHFEEGLATALLPDKPSLPPLQQPPMRVLRLHRPASNHDGIAGV